MFLTNPHLINDKMYVPYILFYYFDLCPKSALEITDV